MGFAQAVPELTWVDSVIREEEIDRYLDGGRDFIDEASIFQTLADNSSPEPGFVRDVIQKSLEIETLGPDETAALLHVDDPDLLEEMFEAASEVKHRVYDNRIVTFAPLYCSNYCVNDCRYCGFARSNKVQKRRRLSLEEVGEETEVLAGKIGHKRLIVVYGEHPLSDVDYIADTLSTIYGVRVPTRRGYGQIRRANVNAAPLSKDKLKVLRDVGIGTFQVFQETYHHDTYQEVHPAGTIKSHYRWRLYAMHRAFEAGVDDVGIGVLFGLYDWRFEVMGLLYHARDLERHFGVGPHTISFPRLEPAAGTPFTQNPVHRVSDEDFRKLVAVLRLSVPYTGMIVTAREPACLRMGVLSLGCTQTDASTRIGIGAYSDRYVDQEAERQQFLLGDTRSLDEVIRELAGRDIITSFCTAGYRCGRTGARIMSLLKSGKEGRFCKLNAILTLREWLEDFASEETKAAGDKVIAREMEEVRCQMPETFHVLEEYHRRIMNGERDLYF
ncbi:MAG TPA: [FeFe] hydrogenase H-cluster radical SAM maturase HydG [Desulfobacteraceae bacterium]|nr:[FeFe] hydrogenase H-cluster radical SAM maturase HydG [Desulfobacteraceae bacterium]